MCDPTVNCRVATYLSSMFYSILQTISCSKIKINISSPINYCFLINFNQTMPRHPIVSFIDSDDDDDDVLREITANKRQAPKLSPKLNQPTKKYKPDSTMADLSSVSHAMPPPACAALPDPKPATLKVLVAGALNFGAVENDEPQMAEYGQVW